MKKFYNLEVIKVSKGAKIRNRYNQVPHLNQDTNGTFILKLKIKRNDWLLADTCPQATNHCALF